jgi:hypothetical protein
MVSVDHFAHELRVQLRTVTEQGAGHILINSTDLCSSVRAGGNSADACIEAMEHEFEHGDVVIQGKGSGSGYIVRYQLPRAGQQDGSTTKSPT